MPLRPASSASQNEALSWPMALRTPMPVRTARRVVPAMMHPQTEQETANSPENPFQNGHFVAEFARIPLGQLRNSCEFRYEIALLEQLVSILQFLLRRTSVLGLGTRNARQPEQVLQFAAEDEVMLP